MLFQVDKLRRSIFKDRVSSGRRPESTSASDLPLDHQLTFSADAGEQWTFRDDNHVFLNNVDVDELITENPRDIQLLCGLSQGLSEYQNHVWSKGGKAFEKFNGKVFSIQDRIVGKLGRIYDDITGGMQFEYDGDDFWINNINVKSVLSLYRLRPTEKARRYLAGLRDKLGLILSGQRSSTRYDGVGDRARGLYNEISLALEYIPADAPLCLGDGRRSA